MKIPIKLFSKHAKLPTVPGNLNAGYDLYADILGEYGESVKIKPHRTVFIPTGIGCAIPEGYFGGLFARSGRACKEGLRPANCVGVIDPSYRGQIIAAIHNDRWRTRKVKHGERIAQLVIMKYNPVEWEEVDELDKTERGDAAFGSTGR